MNEKDIGPEYSLEGLMLKLSTKAKDQAWEAMKASLVPPEAI